MTFIKLNIITIWGVLLIVPNLFSQTQQFEKFLIKIRGADAKSRASGNR